MRIRVLGLGNDLLADDAFGLVAARALRADVPAGVEVVESSAAGLSLLDALQDADRVLVLDTWRRGGAPGSIYRADLGPAGPLPSSPHYVGLSDAVALGRACGLAMPARIACLAVEPANCLSVGGGMTGAVRAALPEVVQAARALLAAWRDETGAVTR